MASGSPENAVLVENGVAFQPDDSLPDAPTIFFGGNLQYLPNREGVSYFVKDIFPTLSQNIPNLHLVIAGRSPERDLLNLASDKIDIVANPSDLGALLRSARVAICPVKWGAGQKNKILDAAAAGRPIVADPHMIEGSAFEAGKHVLTARTPSEWIDAVVRLLKSDDEAEKLRTSARELVRTRYSWVTSSAIIENCYLRLYERSVVK
jgi:glycosyltransferase involved in cell wall biosynthesis